MEKISTLVELKAEQRRLLLHKTFLETEIKKEFNGLKNDLEPLKLLTKGAGSMLSSDNNKILGHSFGSIAGFLTKNVLLRNSGFITRMIVPFLAKNTTSNLVEDNKSKIVDGITKLISHFSKTKKIVET